MLDSISSKKARLSGFVAPPFSLFQTTIFHAANVIY